jgi:hypothetical protein
MTLYVLIRLDDDGTYINFDVFIDKDKAQKAYDIASKHFKCILQPRITADELYDF